MGSLLTKTSHSFLDDLLNALLKHLPGCQGHVDHIQWELWHPSLRLEGLSFFRANDLDASPFLEINACSCHFEWNDVLHKRWIADVEIDAPVGYLDVSTS